MKAFQRHKAKVEFLDLVGVWDWIDNNLRGIQFQSFQRAYLIEILEHDLQILVEILNTIPEILSPKELPEEDLEDILNFLQCLL
jgi:hypothetical protein